MSKYPSYPSYKDSAVSWLGDIPSHWQVKRLKFLCYINPAKSFISNLSKDTEVSFLPMECVDNNGNLDLQNQKTLEEVWQGYTYFENQDVIIAKITPCFENGKGALCKNLCNGIGFGSTEFHVLRARQEKVLPELIYYLTKSATFASLGSSELYGVAGQKRVPESFLSNYFFAYPPKEEQGAIALFLDEKTKQIDELISKKERLIEKLEEKRTAIISYAVTKGLDDTVAMKYSGVEWLGDIPTHWEVKKIQYIARLKSGTSITSLQIDQESLYPVYGGNGLRGYFDSYNHNGNYILIGRQGALCGNINYANGKFWASDHAVVINPSTEFETNWLGELLKTMNLNQYSTSAAQPGLSVEQISRLKIPFPPIQEQRAIAHYLDQKTEEIEKQKEKIRGAIVLLKEYRSALITNTVTGKIDVRGVKLNSK